VFTASEVEAMLRVANVRDRLILEILVGTGLRVSELCALEVSDFRQDHRDGPYLNVQLGKGAKQRIVPLHGHLARRLRHYVARERPTARCSALFVT
jgi:site-specific recombinase XerD